MALLAALVTGCGDPIEVRTYTISGEVPEVLRTSDRMLGAIIPHDKAAWFVKAVGPVDAVKLAEKEVREFVDQLTFTGGEPDLTTIPAGWNRGGKKPMRTATLLIDTPEAQLDVSISQLPLAGDWDEQVAMNVNRWRDQLKLPPSEERWAGGLPLGRDSMPGLPAIWVDLVGDMGTGPARMPTFSDNVPPMSQLASEPTVPAPTVASAASEPNESGLKYDTPAGWRPGKMSMMRLAAFTIGDGDDNSELTVIQAGGDLRGNVARWLGQVRGDTPPGDVVDSAMAAAEKITVSGREATRYYLSGDDPAAAQAIDATIVPMADGMSMFIKATGNPETLRQQREQIGEFIQSLAIPSS